MKIKGSNSPLNVANQNNLVVSLDGIIQEPGTSYTISDSTLTFNQAPLGKRFSEGSYGNDSLTAANPISYYKIRLRSVISQLDLSYFVVGQEFTTSTSTRKLSFYKSGVIATEMNGIYKVIDKGVDGSSYNVVSFVNNVGNNTATVILTSVVGLDSNSAGLAISGSGIPENSGIQGIDLANKTITISGTISSATIGTVNIGNRYVTVAPSGKLLPTLGSVFTSNVLNGITPFVSNILVDGYNVATNAYFYEYNTRNYTAGVDTPSQDFVGRLIKFKDATLNTQNFKKIKNISSQFDNVKTEFDLYYEDNTPVELPSSNNLLVSIDGVIQRSGTTPLLPSDRAYYIKRTTIPNKIVFLEAPRKFEESVSGDIFNKAKQSFFAYNVGAYERLVIDQQYIDDQFKGPFTLRSVVTGKTIPVDDDRNVLVFIEEVLQKRLRAYQIRGSSITFNEPIRVGQKINIVYLYGRNTVKYLTMFDFDHNDYLNRIELQVNYNPSAKQFDTILAYQGNSYEENTATGNIRKFDVVETPLNVSSITADGTTITVTTSTPHNLRENQQIRVFGSSVNEYNINVGFILPYNLTEYSFKYQVPFAPASSSTTATIVYITTTFVMETQNKLFVKTKDVVCVDGRSDGLGDFIIPSASINAIGQQVSITGGSVYFEESEETLDILRKTKTGWLMGSSIEPNYWNVLETDDLIKIDGESEFRNILSVPTEVVKTEYRENADVTTGYLGKISTTNYNGIQLGEGLDILANIDTDVLSPTYGKVTSLTWNQKDYPKYVTNGVLPRPAGAGYEDAPRLYFVPQSLKDEGGSIIAPAAGGGARGYVVVHNGEPIDVVLTDMGSGYMTPPKVYITRGYNVRKSNKNTTHRILTNFFTPLIASNTLIISSGSLLSTEQEPPIIYIETIGLAKMVGRNIVLTATIQLERKPAIPVIQPRLTHDIILELGTAKVTSLNALSSVVFSSSEPPLVKVQEESTVTLQKVSKEILVDLRSFLKLIQSPVYPALHDTGAYLQSPLTKTDPIVYIADTSKFTISGRLMIDGEIIRYDSKLSDRFLGITRGVDGTSAATHDAGTFVRQYRENVSIVSAGLAGAGVETTNISIGSIGNLSASVSNITSIIQEIINPNVVSTSEEITAIVQDNISTNSIVSIGQVGVVGYVIEKTIQAISVKTVTPNISSIVQEIIQPKVANTISSTERFYEAGVLDFYVENIVLDGYITLRTGSPVALNVNIQTINLRGGSTFTVENAPISYDTGLNSYTLSNAGNYISTLESWKFIDTGTIANGGTSLQDLELNYGPLTLLDFQGIKYSAYITSGVYYNGGYPSICESGAVLNNNMTTTSTIITVQTSNGSTNPLGKFPSSGYVLIGTELVSYTGKTATTLTGIARSVNGIVSSHSIGDYFRTTY